MLRNKHTSRKDTALSFAARFTPYRRSTLEAHLLAFLDNFDIYLFLYDPRYRQQLNNILDGFTDEEFEHFELAHSHRFTIN